MDYIAIIHKDPDSGFGVSFPDFPGCVTVAETLEDARKQAADILPFHMQGMAEDGEDIPAPSSLDQVMQDPDFKDGVAFIVSVTPPGRTVRVNITLSELDLQEIDRLAAAHGKSRSAYLVERGIATDHHAGG